MGNNYNKIFLSFKHFSLTLQLEVLAEFMDGALLMFQNKRMPAGVNGAFQVTENLWHWLQVQEVSSSFGHNYQ